MQYQNLIKKPWNLIIVFLFFKLLFNILFLSLSYQSNILCAYNIIIWFHFIALLHIFFSCNLQVVYWLRVCNLNKSIFKWFHRRKLGKGRRNMRNDMIWKSRETKIKKKSIGLNGALAHLRWLNGELNIADDTSP